MLPREGHKGPPLPKSPCRTSAVPTQYAKAGGAKTIADWPALPITGIVSNSWNGTSRNHGGGCTRRRCAVVRSTATRRLPVVLRSAGVFNAQFMSGVPGNQRWGLQLVVPPRHSGCTRRPTPTEPGDELFPT